MCRHKTLALAPDLAPGQRGTGMHRTGFCKSSMMPSMRGPPPARSADPPQPLCIALPALDVDVGALCDQLRRLLVDRPQNARRRADDKRTVGEALTLGDQGAGADQTVAADPGAVEHDRAHADQAVIGDRAAVQNDVVADHAVVADDKRETRIGVQRRVVLDLRTFADLDPLVVAAQHRAEPDAGVDLEPHAPDHARALGNPMAGMQIGPLAVELIDRHRARSMMWSATLPCGRGNGETPLRGAYALRTEVRNPNCVQISARYRRTKKILHYRESIRRFEPVGSYVRQ